jgi:hypothetical protein
VHLGRTTKSAASDTEPGSGRLLKAAIGSTESRHRHRDPARMGGWSCSPGALSLVARHHEPVGLAARQPKHAPPPIQPSGRRECCPPVARRRASEWPSPVWRSAGTGPVTSLLYVSDCRLLQPVQTLMVDSVHNVVYFVVWQRLRFVLTLRSNGLLLP